MKHNPTEEITSKRPVKVNGYKSNKLWAKRDRKRVEAENRQGKRDSRTVGEQLLLISKRRGKSAREVARITNGVGMPPNIPVPVVKVASPPKSEKSKTAVKTSKYKAKKAKSVA